MASGLLQGKGCYDSILRAEDPSHLFQSIRHHNTSFILEQQKTAERGEILKKSQESNLEAEVTEWLVNGALPFLRNCVKYLFLLLLWPLYFSLFQLPELIVNYAVKPLYNMANAYILQPIGKMLVRFIFRPIELVYKKICSVIRKVVDIFERPFLAFRRFVRRVKLMVYQTVIAPPLSLAKQVHTYYRRGLKACNYVLKASYICGKWFARYGIHQVLTFKVKSK